MKKTIQRDLFPGALEMMILRILRRQPSHGYALVQQIKRTSHDLLQIEEGSLYPALQRLLKAELVKAEWGISSTNRRVRIYTLTRAGAKHLEREVSSFEQMLEGITRVLAPGESCAGLCDCSCDAAFSASSSKKFGPISKKRSRSWWRPGCPEKKPPLRLAALLGM